MLPRLPTLIRSINSTTILAPRCFYTSTKAMSTPDLKVWMRDHLTELYTAPDDSAFHSAFEGTFAEEGHASVSVNGEEVSREKYKEDILGQRSAMTKADVKFDNLSVEDTTKAVEGQEAHGPLRFRVRAAPAKMERVSNFEAKIEPTTSNSNDFRIVHLTEAVENKHAPVMLHPIKQKEESEA